MYLSLSAKKGTERNSRGGTTFAKQFYGSAQSSELGTFGVNGNKNNKSIYNPPVPQTALSLI